MGEWSFERLYRSGVMTFSDGYRTKRAELGKPGFRILRVADVQDGHVSTYGQDFVHAKYTHKIGNKLSEPGDILLTTKGTVGRVAIYPAREERVVYSPQLCFFRVTKHDQLSARYLAYWFKSSSFKEQAIRRSNNTDMAPYINLKDIQSLKIELPPITKQRAIAEVLGALDDKIAANESLISTADELAKWEWIRSLSDETDTVPLSSLARFVNGRAFTKGASGTGRVVIRIAELNSGIGGSTVYNDIEVDDDYLARPGDLLFAWSGSLTVARWFREEAIVNQHIFKVIPNEPQPMWLVNQAVRAKLREFQAIAADKATTMGHIQRRHLDEPVLVPSKEKVEKLDTLMSTLWSRALSAEQENLRLEETRDSLLPLLMSGKIRVRDAEKVVEEAV